MSDAVIVRVTTDAGVADYAIEEADKEGRVRLQEHLPARHRDATVTDPQVDRWVRDLIDEAVRGMRNQYPVIRSGPSLVLAGKAGRGKSWQAWGALRALSVSGVYCRWQFVTATGLFASLRPRQGVDSEEVFEGLAGASVLVIDDMGATKDSAWTDEVFDRLVNARYEWMRPTLITTNVPPSEFGEKFGERVTSRLMESATVVPFRGPDLRRGVPGVR
jgi:DNA replication protein DnaC